MNAPIFVYKASKELALKIIRWGWVGKSVHRSEPPTICLKYLLLWMLLLSIIFIIDDIRGSRTWFPAGLPYTTHLRAMWGVEAPFHKKGTPGPTVQDYYILKRFESYSIYITFWRPMPEERHIRLYDRRGVPAGPVLKMTRRGVHTPSVPINRWRESSNDILDCMTGGESLPALY